MAKGYPFNDIEKKWAQKWKDEQTYRVDIQSAKKPFYNLWMFPYPSGARMHVGHAYASTGSDVIGRYHRMHGEDVFQPMGFDAFGIHGENYAIKIGEHPWQLMEDLCNRFRDEQFHRIGHGYDWEKEVRTYWPSYYKWTQWLFVQLFKHGLAERKKALVNWCPSCKTVLADEQVIAGLCERCKTEVVQKELEQWFFKITKYAEKLHKNLDVIDWSPAIVETQRNWIGRKEGITITYEIENSSETVACFTTRPDTNFGATFVVIAPEHPLIEKIHSGVFSEISTEQKDAISEYVKEAQNKSDIDRIAQGRKKTGVFTGLYAINQLNGYRLPVWISDFALGHVGTGAVVGVPGHDTRDFEFAQEFGIEVIRVVSVNGDESPILSLDQVQEDAGIMVNSEFLNGLDIHAATVKMMDYLEEKGWGERKVTYRLRDWLISRQRYWSAPIPMIYCPKCGIVPVPEDQLPVELPFVEDWKPKGDGRGPLANIPEFVHVKCPTCHGDAERETDTIDNFLDSAWYFFRYPFANRNDIPFAGPGVPHANDMKPDSSAFQKWFPVHLYFGGPEHAVLHLMYTRFITMALHDMGYVDFDEPFVKFFAHGIITKDGKKMSKSAGNIVVPDEYFDRVGADTFRMYILFIGPFDKGGDFNDSGLSGVSRFLDRVWNMFHSEEKYAASQSTPNARKALQSAVRDVSRELAGFKCNTAIAKLMEFMNVISQKGESLTREDSLAFLKLLAPFAPFITEELYQTQFISRLSSVPEKFTSVHVQSWPEYDEALLVEDMVDVVIQVNGKMRAKLSIAKGESQNRVEEQAKPLVSSHIGTANIRQVVYVVNKLINFVVAQ